VSPRLWLLFASQRLLSGALAFAVARWRVVMSSRIRRIAALAAVGLLLGMLTTPSGPARGGAQAPALASTRRTPAATATRLRGPDPAPPAPSPATTHSTRPAGSPAPPAAPPGAGPRMPPSGGVYRTTGSPMVALTFDDGPSPKWTPRVLQVLRQYRVRATFCLIGIEVAAHPALVAQIARDGHTLCNHTMRHDMHLATRSAAAIRADMAATSALITKASGGVRPRYFRAPGGRWSSAVVATARSLGMAALGWNVDPQDWLKPPAAHTVGVVRSRCRPGSIVLLHDAGGDRSQTFKAVTTLVPYLRSRYRLAPL
jgi:peptidoglycan/xylan/chitin deacetylase (PgdA/CDA1 family)